MKLRVGLIVFCAVICGASSDGGPGVGGGTAFPPVNMMLKMLAVKFDAMESRLQKMESMQLQLQKNIEDNIQLHHSNQEQIVAVLKEELSKQEQRQSEMFAVLHKLENQVALNFSKVHDNLLKHASVQEEIVESLKDQRSSKDQCQNKMCIAIQKLDTDFENVRNVSQQITNVLPQLHQIIAKVSPTVDCNSVVIQTEVSVPQLPTTTKTTTTTTSTTTTTTTPKPLQKVDGSSCKNVASKVSGRYLIRVKSDSEPFEVYCEQNSHGGGWIVFQYRYDGSLDFYRGWNEFRDGFGDLKKEFWLGLEKVHQITSGLKHEMIIELKDFNGTYKYVRYGAFEIGSERDQYDVKAIGKYSGTAGDVMRSDYKGRKFSTKDRDNDNLIEHCAQKHEGAWWHKYDGCTGANLNGRYMNVNDGKSIHWYYFHSNHQGLSYSRMMVRELE